MATYSRSFAFGFCVLMLPALIGCSSVDALKSRLANVGFAPGASMHASYKPSQARPAASADDAQSAGPTLAYFSQPSSSLAVDNLIGYYGMVYGVPEPLVRRVIEESSNYNAYAHFGDRYGLMQIHIDAARGMGYAGTPEGLFDPDVNLNYGVRYLAGAYLLAKSDESRAEYLYFNGYYAPSPNAGLVEVASQ